MEGHESHLADEFLAAGFSLRYPLRIHPMLP